jgi:hypothetical protein
MTNRSAQKPSPTVEHRFDAALDWYVNGTLDAQETAWFEARLAEFPQWQAKLDRTRAFARTAQAMARSTVPAEGDLGLERLMARLRAERSAEATHRPTPAVPAGTRGWRSAFPVWKGGFLGMSGNALAGVMAVALLAQTGIIAWRATGPADPAWAESRGGIVTQMHTLRVTFSPTASEAQIRAMLVAASARFVGGPTQLGEYWVASSTHSLDEVKASLLRSGLVLTLEVDMAGPKGQ